MNNETSIDHSNESGVLNNNSSERTNESNDNCVSQINITSIPRTHANDNLYDENDNYMSFDDIDMNENELINEDEMSIDDDNIDVDQSINEGNNDTSAIDSGNNDKGDDSDKTIDNYNINSYSNIDISEIKQNNSSIDHKTIIQLTRKTNEIKYQKQIEKIERKRKRKQSKEKSNKSQKKPKKTETPKKKKKLTFLQQMKKESKKEMREMRKEKKNEESNSE